MGNVLDCTGCQNLSIPTHQGTREMCWIVQDVRTCLFQHHQGTREMCWIVQDVRTCLFRHTKGPGKCVGLYRMSEPAYSDTPRDQGNVLDCTGCQNLSIPTHQGTREMCWIVQDVRTCLFRHTDREMCWIVTHQGTGCPRDQGNVLDCTGCQNLSISTHQGTREMCWIVQDVRTCLFRHTKGPGKCVGLYRMSEYSRFILVKEILWDHKFLSYVTGCQKSQV